MKVHVFMVAVVATLATGAVLAAGEGGDTWSEVQPGQYPNYSASRSAPHVDSQVGMDAALAGSEGGDTWSSLEARRGTSVQQLGMQNRPGQTDTTYAVHGSEGGDSWSRFVPELQSKPTNTAGLSSAPANIR